MVSAVTVHKITDNSLTNEAPITIVDVLISKAAAAGKFCQHIVEDITNNKKIRIISARTQSGTAVDCDVEGQGSATATTAAIVFKGGWGAGTAVVTVVYVKTPEHDNDG